MATFAPYKQLQAPQSGISRDLQFWSQDAANKRNQDFEKEKFEYIKEKDALARKDDLYDKYVKPLNPYDTKSQSLNEGIMRILTQAQDQIAPLLQTLENPKSSNEDKISARINLEKINSLPERLKMTTDYHTKMMDSYDKAVSNDQWWRNPEFEKWSQEGFKGVEFGLDENFDPVVAMRDLDGDGVVDVQTFDQIKSGKPTFDFIPKFDEMKGAEAMAKIVGQKDDTIQQGEFKTVQTKGIDEDKLDLMSRNLYLKNGQPTEALRSSLKKAGLEYTPENAETVIEEYKNLVRSFSDTTYKEDFDASGKTSRLKENRIARQTQTSPDGKVILSAIETPEGDTLSNAEVLSSSVKDGKIVLEVSYPKTKSITKQDYAELEKAVDNAKTEKEKTRAKNALALAQYTGKGGYKVTLPGQNERKTVEVSEKDEDWIMEKLGISKEDLPEKTGASSGMSDDEFMNFLNENGLNPTQ